METISMVNTISTIDSPSNGAEYMFNICNCLYRNRFINWLENNKHNDYLTIKNSPEFPKNFTGFPDSYINDLLIEFNQVESYTIHADKFMSGSALTAPQHITEMALPGGDTIQDVFQLPLEEPGESNHSSDDEPDSPTEEPSDTARMID